MWFFSPPCGLKICSTMIHAATNSVLSSTGKSLHQGSCAGRNSTLFHGDALISSLQRNSCYAQRRNSCGISQRRLVAASAMHAADGVAVGDYYTTLGVSRGAPRHEIKKAYRRLALEFHPDVCSGDQCSVKFQEIKIAYESLLQGQTAQFGDFDDALSDNLEGFMGVGDDSWEDWEEWMGWEGAGTRDYSSHINNHNN